MIQLIASDVHILYFMYICKYAYRLDQLNALNHRRMDFVNPCRVLLSHPSLIFLAVLKNVRNFKFTDIEALKNGVKPGGPGGPGTGTY